MKFDLLHLGLLTDSNQQPTQSLSDLSKQTIIARQNLDDALIAIREVPGYEDFLVSSDFESIANAVQSDQPLIYITSTVNGSIALILHQDSNDQVIVSPIWLDALTDNVLLELIAGSNETTEGWFGTYNNRQKNNQAWLDEIDLTTHRLWDLVMGPICDYLTKHKFTQAVLIPTSYLNFLPLHSAWTESPDALTRRHYALDKITFTYAPNARSLQVARAIREQTQVRSLLAINEPLPQSSSVQSLPHSENEIKMAIDYFQDNNYVLKHNQATREAVLNELPNYDVLHFACHGEVNFAIPLDSGLLMANNNVLSLRSLFNMDLQGIRLAILSACETGLPGTRLPDEVVSLPTGLLQAGVAGIAASLWSVADLSTMLLLSKFYKLWRGKRFPPDEALRQAQIWLRNSSEGEIAQLLGLRTRTPNKRPFEHPFYWAAFSYIGT